MENKLSQEERIKELIELIVVDKANFEHIAQTGKINGTLYTELKVILKQAIQFGSDLRAERAKEKIEKLKTHSIHFGGFIITGANSITTVDKDEVLKALEESTI